MTEYKRIALVGAGNVATHLGQALKAAGLDVMAVYSRTEASAQALASKLDCPYTTDLTRLTHEADLYLISVKDDALPQLLPQLIQDRKTATFVHTAGSIPLEVFEKFEGLEKFQTIKSYGVLYPMQTFSKACAINMAEVPLFVEASDAETETALSALANRLSRKVTPLDSEGRKRLHLAAVFACNFTNRCYALAEEVLREAGVPFEVMLPLVDETARKVHELTPHEAQTGPAVRYDQTVIQRHLSLLSGHPDLQKIYEMMSVSIHQAVKHPND